MDVGSCLKRILEWLNKEKKQKFKPESLTQFFGFGFGAVSCPNSNKLAFSYFRVGAVSVQKKFALNFPSDFIKELYANLEKRITQVLFQH